MESGTHAPGGSAGAAICGKADRPKHADIRRARPAAATRQALARRCPDPRTGSPPFPRAIAFLPWPQAARFMEPGR